MEQGRFPTTDNARLERGGQLLLGLRGEVPGVAEVAVHTIIVHHFREHGGHLRSVGWISVRIYARTSCFWSVWVRRRSIAVSCSWGNFARGNPR
jgi:hypothetical protein